MIEFSEKAYLEQSKKEKTNIVKLGYFSGSITHNDDFNMIKESVLKVMKEHSNVELHSVGLLDIPEEFEEVKDICKDIASYIEKEKYEIVEDRKEAVEKALTNAKEGDVVVLLAKGEETYQKVRGVFTPYESDLNLAKEWANS